MPVHTKPRLLVLLSLTAAIALTLPLLAQPKPKPDSPVKPAPGKAPEWPDARKPVSTDLRVPPGMYTAIVLTPAASSAATATLRTANGQFTFRAANSQTLVIPFQTPWQLGQDATITLTGSSPGSGANGSAWGITTSGPVSFEPVKSETVPTQPINPTKPH